MSDLPTRSNDRPKSRDEIDVLIRARYPILYIVSWEEARVVRHLHEIARRQGKELYEWSLTGGMHKTGGPGDRPRNRGVADPLEGLDAVIEYKDPAIYLFKDLHPFLHTRCQGNASVIRKLREVAQELSDTYKTLVICSPLLDLAPELEKDVTVIDYQLPTPAEIERLLQRICRDVEEHANLRVTLDDASRESLVHAASGLTLQEAENVFAKSLVNDGTLDGKDVSTVFAEKQQIIRKSGLLEYCEPAEELNDVGGLEALKEWLTRRSSAFTERARQFGLPAPKGILLVGVQGCGKSLCAKAVSREWKMPLLRFDIGRMFSSLVGSSEENVRRAIAVAETIAPAVMWIDEIDKAFAGSQGSAGTDGGTTARVMSTILTWLSEKKKPVFVVATANSIAQLPPELLRKGRLDEIFFVDLPKAAERERIFAIHLAKRRREPASFDVKSLAAAADGFSGAEIEQAVISSLYDAFYLEREVTTDDILASLRETVPLSRTMNEQITALRSWAEGRARFASTTGAAAPSTPRRKLEV